MSYFIRRAELSDIDPLSRLFDNYRIYYQQASDLDVAKTFIAERLKNQDSTIFVAQSESSQLLGFVQLYPIFSSVSARKSLLLNDLYVSQQARRLGVGRKLMQQASHYAENQKVCWLMLQTERTNDKAQALYESLGYKRDEDCYYYYLPVS